MNYRYKIQNEAIDKLFEAVLKLENKEECYRFFDDLCTISEIQSLSQRYKVARKLINSETYTHIEQETGASTDTISRISKSLQSDSGGYRLVIERADKKE